MNESCDAAPPAQGNGQTLYNAKLSVQAGSSCILFAIEGNLYEKPCMHKLVIQESEAWVDADLYQQRAGIIFPALTIFHRKRRAGWIPVSPLHR